MSETTEVISGITSGNRRAFFIRKFTEYTAEDHPTLRASSKTATSKFATRERAEAAIKCGNLTFK